MTRRTRLQKTATDKPSFSAQPQTLTLSQHIHELRRRLLWSALYSLVVGAVVYMYHDFFVKLVMNPLGQEKLIYLSPAGGFNFIFSVTLYVTLIAVMPFILYQAYAFIRPAIPKHTSRLSLGVGVAATLLMAAGVAFGYMYAIPAGLGFLTNIGEQYVTASLTADAYLNFVLAYVFGVGMLFEVPLLLILLHWVRPLTPKGLLKSERYVVLIAFVLGAVISPTPDILGQTIIAVPIIILYQFGVAAVLFSIYRQRKRQKPAPSARLPEAKVSQPDLSTTALAQPVRPVVPVTGPQEVSRTSHLQPLSYVDPESRNHVRPLRPPRSVDGMITHRMRPSARPQALAASARPLNVTPRPRAVNE